MADRTIIRTWPIRGTLHFVAADDARWMLELLTPRVIASTAPRHRELELDASIFTKSGKLLVRALRDGRAVSRPRLYEILNAAGIATDGSRGLHILAYHAQRQLICFGPREGKQPTFVLFDKWIPGAKSRSREDALAELATRYFTGHGPATVQDFAWWSGLAAADARVSLELAKPGLTSEAVDGRAYWFVPSSGRSRAKPVGEHLLPPFDEYTVAYRDRSAVEDPAHRMRVNAGGGMVNPIIVIGGRVVGTWKRAIKKDAVVVTLMPFATFAQSDLDVLEAAARRYGRFLGRPAVMNVVT